MNRNSFGIGVVIILAFFGVFNGVAHAQTRWRTQPIKTSGNETVSCDLLNVSGKDLNITKITMKVQSLEQGEPRMLIINQGPYVIKDGNGIRSSSPVGTLAFKTVYCEIDATMDINPADGGLFLTMTVDDDSGKAFTTATSHTTVASPEVQDTEQFDSSTLRKLFKIQ